jgi:cytochrome c553
MKYLFPFLILLLLGCESDEAQTEQPLHVESKQESLHVKIKNIENELKKIDSVEYLENYISNIIINGSSNNLGYPAGDMQGGFAYESDAKDIARFVVTLSNQKSSDNKRAKKAEIFFTSNCGGCHGSDGKGLNGAFPDLTKRPLLGLIKKKDDLLIQLDTLKNRKKSLQ